MEPQACAYTFRSHIPSAARLDDLCASARDVMPPSKPVRQVTAEYNRGGTVAKSAQSRLSQLLAQASSPLCEFSDMEPCKPVRTSSKKRQQNTLFCNQSGRFDGSLSTASNSLCSSEFIAKGHPSAERLTNGIESPAISKPMIHAANSFFGIQTKTRETLVDDDDDDCVLLRRTRILSVNHGVDGDISDLEDEVEDEVDDTSRWSLSTIGNRLSSSEHSMPSKPQRRASLLTTGCQN